ncbi:hypothetical protein DSTSK_32070 [Desulforhabdus sp. TSK]|nr:hypothetical protein DSTSK_32070 [Desulforhabdus sp. TSK]
MPNDVSRMGHYFSMKGSVFLSIGRCRLASRSEEARFRYRSLIVPLAQRFEGDGLFHWKQLHHGTMGNESRPSSGIALNEGQATSTVSEIPTALLPA